LKNLAECFIFNGYIISIEDFSPGPTRMRIHRRAVRVEENDSPVRSISFNPRYTLKIKSAVYGLISNAPGGPEFACIMIVFIESDGKSKILKNTVKTARIKAIDCNLGNVG
jgi:hypothetical protein